MVGVEVWNLLLLVVLSSIDLGGVERKRRDGRVEEARREEKEIKGRGGAAVMVRGRRRDDENGSG